MVAPGSNTGPQAPGAVQNIRGPLPQWGMGTPTPSGSEEDQGDSNKRTILKWEQEEEMGDQATISCVLYVNMCHPDLKQKYPDWSERSKQIAKLWRKLNPDEKAPYLSKARKNRTSSRVQKAQKQVSQELQRRQEIQKQQDSEAMPPPPAPPRLTPGGDMYHDGSNPMMVPHPGASPYPRHGWGSEDPMKTPGTPEFGGPQPPQGGSGGAAAEHSSGEQVFSPNTSGAGSVLSAGSVPSSPDPYAFSPQQQGHNQHTGQMDPFSPSAPMRPGQQVRPQLRLPGLQAFGASSPREEDGGLFPQHHAPSGPGMSPRVRPGASSDMFVQGGVPPSPGQDMMGGMAGPPRRMPGPRLSHPLASPQQQLADASNPMGDSPTHPGRGPVDPYAFPPGTPHTPTGQVDDPFLPPGPPTSEAYHGMRYPGGAGQMRHPMTPPGMNQGQVYPGSPRVPEPGFRHPLARSNSMPDPYSMQMGGPRPQMDPSMVRTMSDASPEMYRGGRMPPQHPERPLEVALRRNKLLPRSPWAFPFMLNYPEGDAQGNIHRQHLRVILGQKSKERMAKKQEEAERMMHGGPGQGWQGQEVPEGMEGFPPRPQFRGPVPQGMMRAPHPGMGPQGQRQQFYPGMQRPPHVESLQGSGQEGMMAPDQRSQFMQHMMQQQQGTAAAGNMPSSPQQQQQQQLAAVSQFMSPGETTVGQHPQQQHIEQPQASQQQQQQQKLLQHQENLSDLAGQMSAQSQVPAEPIFSGASGTGGQAKTSGPEDASGVEASSLLEGISCEKTTKPSLSSEDDKNEDDDLLSADGTFNILKYADLDLDLDLDEKMFEQLEYMEDQANGQSADQRKPDSEDSKEDVKDEKGTSQDAQVAAAADFQAEFLEFNQRQKTADIKEEEGTRALTESEESTAERKAAEEKEKEKTEVGQIAAMLQGGTEAIAARLAVSESGASDTKHNVDTAGNLGGGMGQGHPRPPFTPNLSSPHHMQMSPMQPGSSGLPSPKLMHSPRSGQPSPRTPGIQSPFNTLLAGRHSASPHSQPMTPGGPQLSPFSNANAQMPFSPPASAGVGGQPYPQGPGSAPHSPYPISSQPPFSSMPSPSPQHMMSPGYPPQGMGPRPPAGFGAMGPRGPIYGMRGPSADNQAGRFPRPGEPGHMEGVEGIGPRMPQPMTMPDGRPHPMYQQMQARAPRGPPPTSSHPSLQQQLTHMQTRHQYPGQPPPPPPLPRLSHPQQIRSVGPQAGPPRQPGVPFSPTTPTSTVGQIGPLREQHTLLDELLEQEKEEQKRQAEQQAMMHRREGIAGATGTGPDQGMGQVPPGHVGPHPGMRMPGPPDGSGQGWGPGMEAGQPGQFQQSK
ncbi:histone-lysine N-methyltransferase [Plakobranchus ocellatus]|uniref:Histone-lysine N-methyltransferase n=1 Tax=Plakobranchus ocellatus TaxID=259542 RepID=A0AAV3ZF83_9GAST|nr:histone-lysine N-methyltransferase [Plakobranchus ocellatus]